MKSIRESKTQYLGCWKVCGVEDIKNLKVPKLIPVQVVVLI